MQSFKMAVFHLLFCLGGVLSFTNGFLLDGLGQTGEKCYDGLGCFGNRAPFQSAQRPMTFLPADLASIGTKFILYTRETRSMSTPESLEASDLTGVTSTHFSSARATKMIVHGFTHSASRQWVHDMVRELLKHEDINVIAVDWEKGAELPYGQAASNARVVGAQVAQLLQFLANNLNNSHGDVHIIGHSLGAHVAGYAGERTAGMGRISGLDPSDPYFQNTPPQVRLDPSDAQFVDVIHTDSSSPAQLGMGSPQVMGHVDFYPNGGSHQPGCGQDAISTIAHSVWNAGTIDLYSAAGAVACSHLRAIDLFTESINNPCPFLAYPCDNGDHFAQGRCLSCPGIGCSRLGYHANTMPGRGSMYLITQDSSSFCNYHYQLNMTSGNAVDGIITVTLYGDKGHSDPQALTRRNEIFNAGMTISHLLTTRTDVGNMTRIGIRFDKSHTLLIHLLYADTWTLRSVTLHSGETQERTAFCAGGQSVADKTTGVFQVAGHC